MRPLGALAALVPLGPTTPRVSTQRQPRLEELGWEAIGDELRDHLLASVRATPTWRRAAACFVVSLDGVEVIDRAEQARQWRLHGLPQLARRLREISLGRLAVVLLGDEVAVLSVDPAFATEAP